MRNSTCYKIAKAKTFRLSSSMILPKKIVFEGKTKVKGWGGNLQNVEKSMREMYIPDDGYIFVQVDQSGAEALIVAYCCEDGQYRQLFLNGIKPHSYLAMHLFKDVWPKKMREQGAYTGTDFPIKELIDCPIPQLRLHPLWRELDLVIKDSDNWPATERYYYLAKQTEHSSNYDIQPPMFRMNVLEKSGGKVVISKDDSTLFLLTKFSLFPEIKGYHRWVRSCASQHGMLFNLHGHPYTITSYEILDTHWKEHYAWIPQSTVGEITNIAYTRMYQYIATERKKWDLLANTHDSYLLQCPIEERDECVAKAQEFMNQEFKSPIDGAVFRMRSEAQAGFNWRPFHKEKNPLGLRSI